MPDPDLEAQVAQLRYDLHIADAHAQAAEAEIARLEAEVRQLTRMLAGKVVAAENEEVIRLRDAIRRHRDSGGGYDADHQLWNTPNHQEDVP